MPRRERLADKTCILCGTICLSWKALASHVKDMCEAGDERHVAPTMIARKPTNRFALDSDRIVCFCRKMYAADKRSSNYWTHGLTPFALHMWACGGMARHLADCVLTESARG